ncbi:MAG: FHA domain-containing protein [Deltaproteobacteria bacterium]|nr:FHA domain-containing protein [Deltaproteobacteria bacterium]
MEGPLRGATWSLQGRFTIGRSHGSDIQIVDGGVSRQHAQIVASDDGYALIDLNSRNGTFLNGCRIKRSPLAINSEFEVSGCRFIFERVPAIAAVNGDEAEPTTTAHTFRATMDDHMAVVGQGLAFPIVEPRRPMEDGEAPAMGPTATVAREELETQDQIIDAILDYRRLRARAIQGNVVDPEQREYVRWLQSRLHGSNASMPGDYSRYFQRFQCALRAEVRLLTGAGHACVISDVGVGGAKIEHEEGRFKIGDLLWIAVERPGSGRWPSVVLTGRVVWVGATSFGVDFSGSPGQDDGVYDATQVVATDPAAKVQIEPPRSLAQRFLGRLTGRPSSESP